MLISSLSFNVKSHTVMDMSTPFSIVKLGCITVRGNWIKSEFVLEGLAAVVNRVTCFALVPGSTLYVHACHPRGALPAPGLAGCPVGRGE
jgi:hypothetical protein